MASPSSILVGCIEEERAGFAATLTAHPDFPKKGILFLDVFPLLRDAGTARALTQAFAQHVRATLPGIQVILGMESRGFVFGVPLAAELGIGFVPVRKAGKLPGEVKSVSYALEYGTAVVEMQTHHGFSRGARALIVDDLLATGGACASGRPAQWLRRHGTPRSPLGAGRTCREAGAAARDSPPPPPLAAARHMRPPPARLSAVGTLTAAVRVATEVGFDVTAALVVVELTALNGAAGVGVPVHTLIRSDA